MAMNPSDLQLVCDTVGKRAGIELDATKEYLVEARLLPVARRLQLAGVTELIEQLRLQPSRFERDVVDALTTNETSFFRDIHPFDTLKKQVMPALLARRAGEKRLSIWCAASSTGQEPYTIAMTLRDTFPQLVDWKLTFIASDLSRDVLKRARAGRFTQLEVGRGLPAQYLVKYFTRQGLEWEISPAIRAMVDFREINLLEAWPMMPPLDVVFIRNVLIYFSAETKRQILGRIRAMMRPDGFLFLGVAESTLNIDENYERSPFERSGCFQQKTALRAAA